MSEREWDPEELAEFADARDASRAQACRCERDMPEMPGTCPGPANCPLNGHRPDDEPDEPAPDLEALRAALQRAEDNLFSVSMADNYAFTNGNYDAAKRVRDAAKRDLDAALARIHPEREA